VTPVIAIDGPAASGKGTIAAAVAHALGFHYLDSGSLYRLVALTALRTGTDFDEDEPLANFAAHLDVAFLAGKILLDGDDVTADIRSEPVSVGASQVAVHSAVREAFKILPGDRNVRLIVHEPHRFTCPPERSQPELYTHISIDAFAGRSLDAKRALYRGIVENLDHGGVHLGVGGAPQCGWEIGVEPVHGILLGAGSLSSGSSA